MYNLTIYQLFFTKSDCYKMGTIQIPKGIQVHSTGANNSYLHRYVGPDDGILGPNKYDNTHNRSGLDVCANAYIGRLQDGTPAIYQTLPWNMRCWLSASGKAGNANKLGFIGFEICEDNRQNKAYFNEVVMDLSVKLCAYLCQEYNIPVENVLDHKELYKKGLASNHGDITWWLENFGYNMDMYREAVKAAIKEGVQVHYINPNEQVPEKEATIMYKAKVIASEGSTVNLRSVMSAASTATIIARIPVGTIVEVTETPNDKWNRIKYGEKTGYMMARFLQKIEEESSDKNKLQEIKKKLTEAIALIDELLA